MEPCSSNAGASPQLPDASLPGCQSAAPACLPRCSGLGVTHRTPSGLLICVFTALMAWHQAWLARADGPLSTSRKGDFLARCWRAGGSQLPQRMLDSQWGLETFHLCSPKFTAPRTSCAGSCWHFLLLCPARRAACRLKAPRAGGAEEDLGCMVFTAEFKVGSPGTVPLSHWLGSSHLSVCPSLCPSQCAALHQAVASGKKAAGRDPASRRPGLGGQQPAQHTSVAAG